MYAREQQERAWKADIVEYALRYHGGAVKREGKYLRLMADKKVVFHGSGYYDNGTGESGGPVDALMKYFGYTAEQAIIALAGDSEPTSTATSNATGSGRTREYAEIPQRTNGRYSRVWAYLTKTRGIPSDTVNELMKRHLLYQDERGNCVFTNETGDVAEIRGTNSYRPYKSVRRTRAGGFFWLMNEPSEYYRKHVETVYVCESAIDAVSLYLLKKETEPRGLQESVFVSMAGTGNVAVIDGLLRGLRRPETVVVCTDNDEAGEAVRKRYPNLRHLIPLGKDWNDDWKSLVDDNQGKVGAMEPARESGYRLRTG